MEWCKFYAEWGTDPKVQSMSESMRCRHAMLLSLRCASETNKLSEDELLFYFRVTPDQLNETKNLFVSKGFIDENWNVLKWRKRQLCNSPAARRMRALRKRERERNALRNGDENELRNSDVTRAQLARAPDEIRLDENRKEKPPKPPLRGKSNDDFILPDWIPKPDWDDWLAMRKVKRAPATNGALAKAVRDLDKLRAAGHKPDEVLQQSTLRAWTGLFPIASNHTNHLPMTAAEQGVRPSQWKDPVQTAKNLEIQAAVIQAEREREARNARSK